MVGVEFRVRDHTQGTTDFYDQLYDLFHKGTLKQPRNVLGTVFLIVSECFRYDHP